MRFAEIFSFLITMTVYSIDGETVQTGTRTASSRPNTVMLDNENYTSNYSARQVQNAYEKKHEREYTKNDEPASNSMIYGRDTTESEETSESFNAPKTDFNQNPIVPFDPMENLNKVTLIHFLCGPLHLALWVALAPIRVPIGVVFWIGEILVASLRVISAIVSILFSFVRRSFGTLPIGVRFASRGICLACWGCVTFGVFQLLVEKEPILRPLLYEGIKFWKMLVCAAKYLSVPWSFFGASEAQLNRAFRAFALAHHPDKNGGVSSVFVCVSEGLELLKDNIMLRKIWVIFRPILGASPFVFIPSVYLFTCAVMHFWRPSLIVPRRCLKKDPAPEIDSSDQIVTHRQNDQLWMRSYTNQHY